MQMKYVLFVVGTMLLCTLTTVAQNRQQLLKARSNEHLPPRQFADIDSVIVKHQRVLEECYRELKKHNPNAKGKLVVRLVLSPEGNVKDVKIPQDNIANSALDSCLTKTFKRITFTRTSPKQGLQTVEVPLNFLGDSENE